MVVLVLLFLLANIFNLKSFEYRNPQFLNFTEILAQNFIKKAKLKDKTQNSREKPKLGEDFSAPERPSDVKTKSLI